MVPARLLSIETKTVPNGQRRVMLDAIQLDPDLPRQRRTVRSGLVYSGLTIVLALFVLGKLPAVDSFLASANNMLQAHNDQIVHTLLRGLPFGLVSIGSFGLVYKALGLLNKARRSA
jgi:hypothetical protein